MKIKTSKGDRTFQVINILIFAIFAIICAYPFYYLIINSISANDLSASGKVNSVRYLLPFIWDSCLPSSGCGTENCGIVLW